MKLRWPESRIEQVGARARVESSVPYPEPTRSTSELGEWFGGAGTLLCLQAQFQEPTLARERNNRLHATLDVSSSRGKLPLQIDSLLRP